MKVDPGNPLPLYAQVEAAIVESIVDGTFPPGESLPNEVALTAQYRVSRSTIRQCIQNLIRRGLVEIRRGKGTFVLEPKITQELTELTGFVEDMHALGHNASARVLDRRVVHSSDTVARHLQISSGMQVIRIQRVRLANGVPLSFDETYLPREIGEKVVEDDLETEPIFTLLEEKYETPLLEAEYRLEAIAADSKVARALSVRTGSPIFLIERTSFTEGGRPVDYERLHYRGDQVRFTTRLARRPKASRKATDR